MQISRHWRLNATRYRLEGVRYNDGAVSIQERHCITSEENQTDEEQSAEERQEREMAAA